MKYLIVNLALSLALTVPGIGGTTSSRKTLAFELIGKDGSIRARVFAGSDSLLLDFPIQERGYLFKATSYIYLNRTDKTYTIHSYSSIVSSLTTKAKSDLITPGNDTSDLSPARFEITGETDLIAGLRASKIVRTRHGKVEIEIWVSEENTPHALQAVGREIRAILPANHWSSDNQGLTLLQATLLFGVPVMIIDHENESVDVTAVIIKSDNSQVDLFNVPSEYRERKP